jgi:polar amino acid transport system permease protein
VSAETPDAGARPGTIQAVPLRHPGRWLSVAVIAVIAAMAVHSVLTNPNWGWAFQRDNAFTVPVLQGLRNTLWLTIASMLIGLVLGVVIAVMRLSRNPILSSAAWLYTWAFRGTPVYVQLLLWAQIGSLYRKISLGVPFGPAWFTFDANTLIPAFAAALLGLGLNEAAYMAEIVRAGLISVDHGQREAADALGMARLHTMFRIILPQAMRVIIPPTGNETISMLKTTSLVVVIPYYELLFNAEAIGHRTFQPFPMLIMASLYYLGLSSVLMVGQYYIERHYARGASRSLPLTPVQKVLRRVGVGSAM